MYKPSKPYKKKIIDEIQKTWDTPYISVSFNTYPVFVRKFSYPEVDHTDGIGTKGFYHWKQGTLKSAVVDALAMNLNDLAIVRAVPYKLSNHITLPVEDVRVFKIVQEIARQCLKRKIAIAGGENSFHNNMNGMDISMTVSGFIKKVVPNKFRVGDILIGLKSSGLHSNGITMVRKLFSASKRIDFTTPTEIYLDDILNVTRKCEVHGMMHITGGAFTKLKDILGNADAHIYHPKKFLPHKIFMDIYKKGVSNETMYSTFNCGIGYVLSVPKKEVIGVLCLLRNADVIGEIFHGNGHVYIRSAFNGKEIVF